MDVEDFKESCALGNRKNALYYIQRGIDINHQNKTNGFTALHWAYSRGHDDIVQLLKSHGADENIKDSKGRIPQELQKSTPQALPILPNYLKNPEAIKLWQNLNEENPPPANIVPSVVPAQLLVQEPKPAIVPTAPPSQPKTIERRETKALRKSDDSLTIKILVERVGLFNESLGYIIIPSTNTVSQLIQQIKDELMVDISSDVALLNGSVPIGRGQYNQPVSCHFDGRSNSLGLKRSEFRWDLLIMSTICLIVLAQRKM